MPATSAAEETMKIADGQPQKRTTCGRRRLLVGVAVARRGSAAVPSRGAAISGASSFGKRGPFHARGGGRRLCADCLAEHVPAVVLGQCQG
jgi:hypothetical protein